MLKIITGVAVIIILTVYFVIPVVDSPEGESLDVIIIDGQSNAEYSTSMARTNSALIDLPIPHHDLLYYGTEDAANRYPGSDESQIWSMNRDGLWMIGGLEPYLAYTYSERSGNDVLTINVSRGAMSISWLAPSGEGGQYASETISDALSKIKGYSKVNMVGWVMLQGEADKNMDVDTYKTYFLDLEDYFTSIGAEQCYIGATRPYWGGNSTIAQEELASEYSDIHIATEISNTFTEENGLLVNNDPIHYSQKGRNVIATAIAENMDVPTMPGQDLVKLLPILIIIATLIGTFGLMFTRNRED